MYRFQFNKKPARQQKSFLLLLLLLADECFGKMVENNVDNNQANHSPIQCMMKFCVHTYVFSFFFFCFGFMHTILIEPVYIQNVHGIK